MGADSEKDALITPQALHVTVSPKDRHIRKGEAPDSPFSEVFPKWLRVAKRWFEGDEKWKARGYAATNMVLALVTTLLLLQISYVQRRFHTAMSGKDVAGFYAAVRSFCGLIAFAVPLFALAEYMETRLVLEWRRWLTRELLLSYFADRAYFRLTLQLDSVDNPDQRICDDVPAYVRGSTMIVLGLTRKIFNIFAFSGVLWSIAPNLVYFLVAYALVGTLLTTRVFGKRLMQLTFMEMQREGNLRFDLVRTRENAESIAFYGGEAREAAVASGRLLDLVGVTRLKLLWGAGLSVWTNLYTYATILIPSLLTAPRYFSGELEFGAISQVGFAFMRIEQALSLFVNNLQKLSGLAAETERLDALGLALAVRGASPPGIRQLHSPGHSGLSIRGLTLLTPNGVQLLCKGLDLAVRPGESLLVVGPSGSGKSSLLRAIAGLWSSGSGEVTSPERGALFFLPQQPFMPLGTLRQQLLFPSGTAELRAGRPASREESSLLHSGRTEADVTDLELLSLLDEVSLPELAQRVGGLEAEVEWAHVLSLGEQQRVAMARLLLHRPALAFLDEATSALDSATETRLYAALRRCCPCHVSVGHRVELLDFHTHVLESRGEGAWQLHTAEEYRRQHPSGRAVATAR